MSLAHDERFGPPPDDRARLATKTIRCGPGVRERIGRALGLTGGAGAPVVGEVRWVKGELEATVREPGQADVEVILCPRDGRPGYLHTDHLTIVYRGPALGPLVADALRTRAARNLARVRIEDCARLVLADPQAVDLAAAEAGGQPRREAEPPRPAAPRKSPTAHLRVARGAGARTPARVSAAQVRPAGGWLAGKVAVVTGSGRGIGLAIAQAMSAEGAKVVVNARGRTPDGGLAAEAAAAQIVAAGGEAVATSDSIATVAGAERVVQQAIERFGRIDVLVNNAAITRVSMLWDMTEEEWDEVVTTNLKGTWACIRAAAPHMIRQRAGRIVNVSSDASLVGYTGASHYSASKAGVIGLTVTAALELGVYGVTVNAIWPSARSVYDEHDAEWRQRYRFAQDGHEEQDTNEQLAPADVAPMVVYLARDAARDVNAQVFRVFGGTVARVPLVGPQASIVRQGRWTQEELAERVPRELVAGVENPAPPAAEPVWRRTTSALNER